jgi:hypothetical protein
MLYTLYEIKTGKVLQSGSCPNKDCLPDKPDGADFLFGFITNPDNQMIQDGVAVVRVQEQVTDADHTSLS